MLLGESGTGKEVLARVLHQLSARHEHRFMAINCAAIPENLLESELFGYEKGAFTGAARQTLGKVELAHGGTFFLDEVGDLPMSLQAKLLRFLQERVIERVGGHTEIPVDVRIVCATHQNLKDLTVSGSFREDLVLSLVRNSDQASGFARTRGRCGITCTSLPEQIWRQGRTSFTAFQPGCLVSDRGPPMARQRSRNGELRHARSDHGGRRANYRGRSRPGRQHR